MQRPNTVNCDVNKCVYVCGTARSRGKDLNWTAPNGGRSKKKAVTGIPRIKSDFIRSLERLRATLKRVLIVATATDRVAIIALLIRKILVGRLGNADGVLQCI